MQEQDDIVKVVACPKCGDMWIADENIIGQECLCFRCNTKYTPNKVMSMWRFVFELCKQVKGK